MLDKKFQISIATSEDRHPELFAAAVAARPDAKDVLSFGCSTGQEVATLARYFPEARVVGTEVNPHALYRARVDYPQHEFFTPGQMIGQTFDVIFAMSVLCLWPETDGYLPFDEFQEACAGLDTMLRPGGLIVAFNTAYDLRDALPNFAGVRLDPFADKTSIAFVTPRNPDGSPRRQLPFILYEKAEPGSGLMGQTCGLCLYYKPGSEDNADAKPGVCRRFPPMLTQAAGPSGPSRAAWPEVTARQWCGEFRRVD